MKKAISIIVILLILINSQVETQVLSIEDDFSPIVINPESDKKPLDL
ncbi:MAG: hypothetical protein K0S51_810 [Bacillales bacterium]|jgi:hypothetical protein|nr:hypothetical protein [Bacillales bacterium]